MAKSGWTDSSCTDSSHVLSKDTSKLGRKDFPSGFKFGVTTSAYQVEGAALEEGKGMNIWDSFSHIRGNIYNGATGDVASDHYHRYEGDVQLMGDLGLDAYRFSVSWSRIFPDGFGEINQDGVTFYNRLINALLMKGIEPYVTLYHWDMPLILENDPTTKGWRTKEIVKYFARYADTCFQLFGDRVKNWITMNEPFSFAYDGYGTGKQAPGRCSAASGSKRQNKIGDSSTEPYVVAHNVLLSHAAAVKIYRNKYQAEQRGRIGISVNSKWYEPYTSRKEDVDAAQRCIEFEMGWILDPIILGDYPQSMRRGVGSRLPCFTEQEVMDLQGSIDFVGYNYYTAYYAKSCKEETDPKKQWFETDRMVTIKYSGPDGKLIGDQLCPTEFGAWLYDCPWGLCKMLAWMEGRYGKETFTRLPILITENGTMDTKANLPMDKSLDDWRRIQYLSSTLEELADAIRTHDYNVQGYFAWSILDNFEWEKGLSCRFGLYYVDFENDQKRYPRRSAIWYRNFLNQNNTVSSSSASSSSSKATKKLTRGCLGIMRNYNCRQYLEMLLNFIRSPSPFHQALEYVNQKP